MDPLADFRIRPIVNLDETGVAACLRESLIFLSLGQHEGLPLPPAEAMACGAIVVGYDGFGGREYMRPEFGFLSLQGTDWSLRGRWNASLPFNARNPRS